MSHNHGLKFAANGVKVCLRQINAKVMGMAPRRAIQPFKETARSLHVQFLKAIFDGRGINCALDVGANMGQTRDFLRDLVGFRGDIISFEPNPAAFATLTKCIPPGENWQAIRVALGPEEGERKFNVMANDKFSSFLEPHSAPDGAGHVKKEAVVVQVRRLDRYVAKLLAQDEHRKFFLKLDTQGFDIEVMKGLADQFLDSVPVIQIELALQAAFYPKAPRMLEAVRYLRQRGYFLAAAINTLSDAQYRGIEMDGIFVR